MKSSSPFMSIFGTSPDVEASGLVDPTTVLPLNAEFPSFAAAMHSWMNASGYGSANKDFNRDMVIAFCTVQELGYIQYQTEHMMRGTEYFPTTTWLKKFLADNKFFQHNPQNYFLLDLHNRPIATVSIAESKHHNIELIYTGVPDVGYALRELCEANVETMPVDDNHRPQPTYIDFHGIDSDGDPEYSEKTMHREGALLDAYYPYIEGGIRNLLLDFIQSDESVLILMGPPGTGKSSALMYAISELNLLPIYTTKTDVVLHPEFVSKLFYVNDKYLDQMANSKISRQKRNFVEQDVLGDLKKSRGMLLDKGSDVEDETIPRIPMAVIEDQDIIMRPRTDGNPVMGQLLNEVDGVGSHYARKLAFTTNLSSTDSIDPALLRDGRCFEVVQFRNLTPFEAIAARAAAGLPDFETIPTTDMPLATALRKPRKRYSVAQGKVRFH